MIEDNVKEILKMLPSDVTLVAAVKYASKTQIEEAIEAGVTRHRLQSLSIDERFGPIYST